MRLRSVALVVTFVLGLLIGVLPAEAQQAEKVYRIGYLSVRGPDREKRRLAAFQRSGFTALLGFAARRSTIVRTGPPLKFIAIAENAG